MAGDLEVHHLGALADSAPAYGVAVSSNRAYLAAGDAGFRVINLTNWANPKIGECNTRGYALRVAVAGNYAYVAEGPRYTGSNYIGGGLEVIDISDPANPHRVGEETNGIARRVAVSGNFACIVSETNGFVIDISDPANPHRVGNFITASYANLTAVGNFVYMADHEAGLQIIDISNPASPRRVGNYHASRDVVDVAVRGNYAYVAEAPLWDGRNFVGPGGLQVLNISDPMNPQPVGSYHQGAADYVQSVSVDGNYAYVFAVGLFDICDPSHPKLIVPLPYGPNDDLDQAVISGDSVYVPDYAGGLHVFDIRTPFELSSITSTTNGVRVAWTDPGPGQAYTVQVRESLTSGDWRNAATRYRWPWPFTHWGDAPRNFPAARYYRVLTQPAAIPNRGKLLTSYLKGQFTVNDQNAAFAAWGIADFATAKFGIISRVFTYETVDAYGLSITNSALLILPLGTNGPLPMVSEQHGATVMKSEAPSQPGHGDIWASVFASYGYAVVVPDYLGLGSSPGYQAYLHARSEATCVVDALRAGKSLCASNNVTLNGQLLLTGYSQGGHVTMAAHRELETFHTNEFTVTACAPCAGSYDLGGVTVEAILANPAYPNPFLFSIILASYLPIYELGDTLEELLAEPYRRTLPPLLDGAHNPGQIAAVMPADMFAILRPDFQADFRTNISNPLRQALLDNNTYSWTPKAPVKMFHCQGDDIVAFANAQVAYQSFTNRGACCVSVVDPGAPAQLNHDDCYNPSLREVLAWFETLRQ
jgi:hypothetical protein